MDDDTWQAPLRALVCVACATHAPPWITLNPQGLHL